MVSENVFLPVTPQIIISISKMVSVPEIVCIPNIVCGPQVPQIVFIPELHSGVSLVPHACDSWVSAIGEWRDAIALRDGCDRVLTRARKGTATRRERRPLRGRW